MAAPMTARSTGLLLHLNTLDQEDVFPRAVQSGGMVCQSWSGCPQYLKFHEVIMDGSVGCHHEDWIREGLIHDLGFMEQTPEEENYNMPVAV